MSVSSFPVRLSLSRFLAGGIGRKLSSNCAKVAALNGPSLKDFVRSAGAENDAQAVGGEENVPYVSPGDIAAKGRKGKCGVCGSFQLCRNSCLMQCKCQCRINFRRSEK